MVAKSLTEAGLRDEGLSFIKLLWFYRTIFAGLY